MSGQWVDRSLNIAGLPAHYLEAGRGEETVLLVHGGLVWCSAELTYGAVIPLLARSFRVIALDVVGFGLTPGRDPEDFSAEAQGRFIVQFLKMLGTSVHIGGNSHGGWLAQYVAHEAPDLVRRIIIINSLNGTSPIPDGYPLPRDVDEAPSEEGVRRNLLTFYLNPAVVTPERVRRTYELTERNFDLALARRRYLTRTPAEWNSNLLYKGQHISEFASRLRQPVLMTWSRENTGASPADATVFLSRLRDAEMHVWTNARHHVQTEHPEGWTDVVVNFLRSKRPG
jgi:pimeloyl-ACP methyl ester carboxylesterase